MPSMSKYVYIDKLDIIADRCNNKYHRTINSKPNDVKESTYVDFDFKIMKNILNLKLMIM